MKINERSQVFFSPYDKSTAFLKSLRTLFSNVANVISTGDSVAVKLHMGE